VSSVLGHSVWKNVQSTEAPPHRLEHIGVDLVCSCSRHGEDEPGDFHNYDDFLYSDTLCCDCIVDGRGFLVLWSDRDRRPPQVIDPTRRRRPDCHGNGCGPTCLERRITPPEGTDSSGSSWLRASCLTLSPLPRPSSADTGELDDGSVVILGAPEVELVVRGLKLVLFVMFFCVLSFLLRAIAICVYIADGSKFQGSLWLPYLLFVELLPECICLVFYLLPGVEALCRGSGLMCCQRVVISSRVSSSVEASVTGSC